MNRYRMVVNIPQVIHIVAEDNRSAELLAAQKVAKTRTVLSNDKVQLYAATLIELAKEDGLWLKPKGSV